MKKKHAKCYLLIGTVLVLLLALLCSFTLIEDNIKQAVSKNEFESIYTKTKIDFLIPSPSYSQIAELEGSNGINTITPYYETSSTVSVNGNTAIGTTVLLPESDKVEYTPYCDLRIISGEKNPTQGAAVVDTLFAKNNKCSVGDNVSIEIRERQYSFTIASVSEDNTFYQNGSIALILTNEEAEQFQNDGICYSAAYVSADDIDLCKSYLISDYKPMGRLKDRSEFEDDEKYSQHLQNFNDADWSEEITNCNANYEELSVKYKNTEASMFRNIAIMSFLVLIVCIAFNTILLKKDSMKKFMKNILVKKSGSKSDIKRFYKSGILMNDIVFVITIIAINVLLLVKSNLSIFGLLMTNSLIPALVSIVAAVIMICVSKNYVEKHYKIRTVKKNDKTETIVEVV